jgi:hypothetical protein
MLWCAGESAAKDGWSMEACAKQHADAVVEYSPSRHRTSFLRSRTRVPMFKSRSQSHITGKEVKHICFVVVGHVIQFQAKKEGSLAKQSLAIRE